MGTDNATATLERVAARQLRVGRLARFQHSPDLIGRTFKITSVQTSALRPETVLVSAADIAQRNVRVTMRLAVDDLVSLVTP